VSAGGVIGLRRPSRVRHWVSVVASTIAVIAILAVVVVVWPASLGGQFVLAGVSGNAHNHGLHEGDLLVARKAVDYHPGDLIVIETYRNGDRSRMIQPVVANLGPHDYLVSIGPGVVGEPWPVSRESILGREILVIPQGARVALLFLNPWFLGIAVTTLVAVLLWPQRDPDDAPPVPNADSDPLTPV